MSQQDDDERRTIADGVSAKLALNQHFARLRREGLYPYPDEAREMKRQTTGAKPGRQAPSGEQTQKETGHE